MTVPRLVPELPLPPYTYFPHCGHPHPTSDPAGHSYGRESLRVDPSERDEPERSLAFPRGCDLFNAGYYWEAHEAWESVWQCLGRTSRLALAAKGLIHLAAAGVKVRERVPAGVVSHATRARELFITSRGRSDDPVLGLDLEFLANQAAALAARDWSGVAVDSTRVTHVLDFIIVPKRVRGLHAARQRG
jgi:predicted metal-dependent hydrolase